MIIYGILFYIEVCKSYNDCCYVSTMIFPFKTLVFLTQAVLVGYLSQYFCEKNSLEEELSLLRRTNDTNSVDRVEEEIRVATRNAYLYATGMSLLGFSLTMIHAWSLYLACLTGMKNRILLTAVIYDKVTLFIWLTITLLVHACNVRCLRIIAILNTQRFCRPHLILVFSIFPLKVCFFSVVHMSSHNLEWFFLFVLSLDVTAILFHHWTVIHWTHHKSCL